jgi:dipeptidyl aminopeptidase/acylaminoacyl peptidase
MHHEEVTEMTSEQCGMSLADFWALKLVSDVQGAPDGRTVAYVVGSYDEAHNKATSAIWLVGLDDKWVRQFTAGEAADTAPRWSPDGARLAFVSTRHEDKPQIYIINRDGGEPRRITDVKDGAFCPVWSPDGRHLCYSVAVESDRQKVPGETAWFEAHKDADGKAARMRRQTTLVSRLDGRGYVDRRTHLFLIDVDAPNTEPRQLTDGDYDDTEPTWSPDGAVIAFISNRTVDAEYNLASDVWTIDVESGALTRLTDENLSAFAPAWSPEGATIAFYAAPEVIAHGYHDFHLWTVSRTGGGQRDLSAALDQSYRFLQPDYEWPTPTPPAWSPDGKTLYLSAADHGDGAVYAAVVATGEVQRISPTDADVVGVRCMPDGQTLVLLASTPLRPYDLFTLPASGGELTPLTRTNETLLNRVSLVAPERLTFEGPDGLEIEGWLYRPLQAASQRPYPLVLNVHGGPRGAWGNLFMFQAQTLATAGYASLYVNPRGSVGHGQAFARRADWGEKDFGDLMAGIDAVLAQGEVDPRRLGVTGISYGGFMTLWTLGHTDRFAAGVAVNGVSNMISMYGVSDITALWFEREFGGPFWTSEEQWRRYRHHSPISYVDYIAAPLLLIQSENDYRCPIEQGEQMLTALRIRRQTVELVRVPGASHVIATTGVPHQRYFQWKLVQDWFDQYLKGEERADAMPPEEAGVTAQAPPLP